MATGNEVNRITKTAAADTMFRLADSPLWFREVNIHCLTNNCYYGDRVDQDAPMTAGDVLTWQDTDLSQWFFKNRTAGSNTVIKAIGVLMTRARMEELGIQP